MTKAEKVIRLVEEVTTVTESKKPQLTLYDLLRNTERYNKLQSKIGRVPPPHQDLRVLEWRLVPRVGVKTLLVTALVEPGTPGKPPRKTVMQFFDVEYADPEEVRGKKDWFVLTTEVRGEPQAVVFKRIDAKKNPVQVRCSCEDFYFRFAWYLKQKGSFYGRGPKPYQRKTTTRPSVNIHHIPAMCKHLWNLARALTNAGVVTGLTFGGPKATVPHRKGQVVMSTDTFVKIIKRMMGGR